MNGSSRSPPRLLLIPLPTPGRVEIPREITLKYTQKVGRAVPSKAQPARDNAIFDTKVLSRSHAEIWFNNGKVYIKDTKSSNGTFVNDERLSPSGIESEARVLQSGDRLKLGVDVLENNTAAHKCVQLEVRIEQTDLADKAAAAAMNVPLANLILQGTDALVAEIKRLRQESEERSASQATLAVKVAQAEAAEEQIRDQLAQLSACIEEVAEASPTTEDIFDQEKLVLRIEFLEAQLNFYMNRTEDSGERAQTEHQLQNIRDRPYALVAERVRQEELLQERIRAIEATAGVREAELQREIKTLAMQLDTKATTEAAMVDKLSEAHERHQQLLKEIQARRTSASEEKAALEELLLKTQEELSSAKGCAANLAQVENDLSDARKRIEELGTALEQRDADEATLVEERDGLRQNLESLRACVAELESRTAPSDGQEAEKLQQELSRAKRVVADAMKEIEAAKETIADRNKKIEELKSVVKTGGASLPKSPSMQHLLSYLGGVAAVVAVVVYYFST